MPRTGVLQAFLNPPDGFVKSWINPLHHRIALGPRISVGVVEESATDAAAAADTADANPGEDGLFGLFGGNPFGLALFRDTLGPGPKSPLIHRASGELDFGVL
tara:strand:- start:423 stop:731 length:309 start_codon:yes stop_codon:yes gene_type:complete